MRSLHEGVTQFSPSSYKEIEQPSITVDEVHIHWEYIGSGSLDENLSPKPLRLQFIRNKPSKTLAQLPAMEELDRTKRQAFDKQTVSSFRSHEFDPHLLHHATQIVEYYIPVCKFVCPCNCHPKRKPPTHRDARPTSSRCEGVPCAKRTSSKEHGEPGQTHFVKVEYAMPWRWRFIKSILASQRHQPSTKVPIGLTTLFKIPRCLKLPVEGDNIHGIKVVFAGNKAPVQDGTGSSRYTVLIVSAYSLKDLTSMLIICGR